MNSAKDFVRRFLLEVRSGKHPERAERFMAPRVRAHQVQAEAPTTVERTPQQYTEHIEEMLEDYGPFEFVLNDLLAEEDRIYARWTQHGHHLAPIDGYAPTGAPLTQVASAVYRVESESIIEYWIQIDRQGILAQLQS